LVAVKPRSPIRVTVRKISQDSAGFGFVYKAHPAAHIEIRVGGCNAADGPKDKQDVELFFAGSSNPVRRLTAPVSIFRIVFYGVPIFAPLAAPLDFSPAYSAHLDTRILSGRLDG
jgi:hypothetical protein